MKKRWVLSGVILLSLLLSIIFVSAASNPAGVCGGVKICGEDFECGANDGVCPQTYGATCTSSGVCCDPDCGSCGPVCGDGICGKPAEKCDASAVSCGCASSTCSQTYNDVCVGNKLSKDYNNDDIKNSITVTDSCANNCVSCSCSDCSPTLDCSAPSYTSNNCIDGVCGAICDENDNNPCTTVEGYAGTQDCNSNCNGWNACVASESCGDGVVNGFEECEGSDCNGISGERCESCFWVAQPDETDCYDSLDNDCDGTIDCHDLNCSEGSGDRENCCTDKVNNDDDGAIVLIDADDPDCCDYCTNIRTGNSFTGWDTSGGACVVPSSDLSSMSFNTFCCGDNDDANGIGENEYYVTAGVGDPACCDSSSDCVDDTGTCRVGNEGSGFDNCDDGLDNDCDGLIDWFDSDCVGDVNGVVFDAHDYPLYGVVVTGSPPSVSKSFEKSSITGVSGKYYIDDIMSGEYIFIASKKGYDEKVKTIRVISDNLVEVNFTLEEGNCHADCTDWKGDCNPDCDEVGDCSFIDSACYYRPKGFVVNKVVDDVIHEFTCCEGPERTYPKVKPVITGNMENLYDYTFNVKLGNRYVKMHLLMFKNNN